MAHTSDIRVRGYEPLLAPAALLQSPPSGVSKDSSPSTKSCPHGDDDRAVVPNRECKSIGCEETFAQDIQGDPLKGPGEELNEAADEAVKRFALAERNSPSSSLPSTPRK